jgi:hypothetical protein
MRNEKKIGKIIRNWQNLVRNRVEMTFFVMKTLMNPLKKDKITGKNEVL